jgi:hypothetical protein
LFLLFISKLISGLISLFNFLFLDEIGNLNILFPCLLVAIFLFFKNKIFIMIKYIKNIINKKN